MKIRIKEDSVEVSGYVNAIERKSKPLMSRMGQFVEKICKGAFKRAIARNANIRLLLNHNRDLGGTAEGNLELSEDNIGLYAKAKITDPEVIQKARNGDLVGWSFGFMDICVENKKDEDGLPLRNVKDLNLEEVSILDKTKTPAYDGTLVSIRNKGDSIFWGEAFLTEQEKEEPKKNDYSKIDRLISDMKSDKIEEEDEVEDEDVDEIDQQLDKLEKELLGDEEELSKISGETEMQKVPKSTEKANVLDMAKKSWNNKEKIIK